jgi:hypothetical protein
VAAVLATGDGLEAALLKQAPSEPLKTWIARKTGELLLPSERAVMSAVIKGGRTLRLWI